MLSAPRPTPPPPPPPVLGSISLPPPLLLLAAVPERGVLAPLGVLEGLFEGLLEGLLEGLFEGPCEGVLLLLLLLLLLMPVNAVAVVSGLLVSVFGELIFTTTLTPKRLRWGLVLVLVLLPLPPSPPLPPPVSTSPLPSLAGALKKSQAPAAGAVLIQAAEEGVKPALARVIDCAGERGEDGRRGGEMAAWGGLLAEEGLEVPPSPPPPPSPPLPPPQAVAAGGVEEAVAKMLS
jgi:hypothetical protein